MPESAARTVRSVPCTRCGCGCDDLDLTIVDNRVVEASRACDLGRAWLLAPRPENDPPALVEGRPAEVDEAAAAAAALLAAAERPLVWGLLRCAAEAQRVAVEIAERVRGVVDPAAGPNHPAAVTAFQEWGEVNTTLGEPRVQRSLVVIWLADVERTHPRLLERWRITGDGDERLLRFRHGDARGDDWAVPRGRELAFLWILRELALGGGPGTSGRSATSAGSEGSGVAAGDLRTLAARLLERLRGAGHVVFVFEAAAMPPAHQHALRALAATLNAVTRFRLVPLRGGGNRIGAEAVLTWQTGFPIAVDFSTGAPRANGGEHGAARLLERGAADAALVVGADPAEIAAEPALGRLAALPLAVLDSEPNSLWGSARVVMRGAPYGLASRGTHFRMDGVALSLRPALVSRYPDEETWLRRILAHLPRA